MDVLPRQAPDGGGQDVEPLLEIDPAEEQQDPPASDLGMLRAETAGCRKLGVVRRIEPVGDDHAGRAMDEGRSKPHLLLGRVVDRGGPGEDPVLEPQVEQYLLQPPALEDVGIERAMRPDDVGLAQAQGEAARGPIVEEVEGMDVEQVESRQVALEGRAHRPGGEPDPGGGQREEAQPHPVARLFPRRLGRLAEIGGVDGHFMAEAGDRARHLEARLGRPAAEGRQIADDVEDAQRPGSFRPRKAARD